VSSAAELVFAGGRVVTVDPSFSVAEAVAIAGDRIAAVGSTARVLPLAGPNTRIVDLAGATVLPGLNDAHLHLGLYGLARPPFALALESVASLGALRDAVAAAAAAVPAGTWIRGEGFDRARLGRAPHRADLDRVSLEHPVALADWTHHVVCANSAALERAGVARDTPDPPGGRIVRDAAGEPTGELVEAAQRLVLGVVPPPSASERQAAIEAAARELLALGVTSVTDPAVWPELLHDYAVLHQDGRLGPRLNLLLHWDWPSVSTSVAGLEAALAHAGVASGLGDDRLRIRGVKLFADGVPSLGTAWMSEPYADGGTGSLVCAGEDDESRVAELRAMIELLHRRRLQVQVHATGDRACATVVDAFVRALELDPWPNARHVVIHGNFLSEADAARMAAHGLVANVNSLVRSRLGEPVRQRLGAARFDRTMPWGTLVRAGVRVADSSDAPIVAPDWPRALEALVTREGGEALERADALRAWTIAPAYQDGQEREKGSIEPGKLADLTVVAEDPLSIDDRELHTLTPLMTILGGTVAYEA
jgi:predicted amidohydrolase YtcJ